MILASAFEQRVTTLDLSIIIINWNSVVYLRGCLASIIAETKTVTFEVIVIDNGSHDGCEELLRAEFPQVRFVQSLENLGFGRANNLAFRYSAGEIVLFLNPDTKVINGALDRMATVVRSNSRIGAVGALLLNGDGSLQTSCVQAFPTLSNQLLDSGLLRTMFPTWSGWGLQRLLASEEQAVSVDVISGAAFMVKRCVFEEVGLFAPTYFMYADDVDLSYNIKKAGYSIVCLTDCQITHFGGQSSVKQVDYFAEILQRESMAQFFLRTRGRLYTAVYRLGVAAAAALRLALVVCLAPFGVVGLNGQTVTFRLGKWLRIFGWAVGIDALNTAGQRDIQGC